MNDEIRTINLTLARHQAQELKNILDKAQHAHDFILTRDETDTAGHLISTIEHQEFIISTAEQLIKFGYKHIDEINDLLFDINQEVKEQLQTDDSETYAIKLLIQCMDLIDVIKDGEEPDVDALNELETDLLGVIG